MFPVNGRRVKTGVNSTTYPCRPFHDRVFEPVACDTNLLNSFTYLAQFIDLHAFTFSERHTHPSQVRIRRVSACVKRPSFSLNVLDTS